MKKKKGSVLIAGYYGFGNAGDELVLTSVIQQLREHDPDVEVAVLSQQPDRTAVHFNVTALNRWKPWTWLGTLWKTELLILGGGGLLQESTGSWNHAYYLAILVLAKCLSCRTEVRAIGVDPSQVWLNRVWTRFVLNTMTNFISVRDADSQRVLETMGVYRRIFRMPDPVIYLKLPHVPAVKKAPEDLPRLAWAISPWAQRPGWEHDISLLLEHVARELNVAHDLLVFFPEQDEALSRRVQELAACTVNVRVWQQPEDLLVWVQEYDLIIGMRYHALVLAALAKKTFIGWGYQLKVRNLCRDFNQPMWTFERGWDGDAVFRQIGDAWKRREILPERYREPLSRMLTVPVVATETTRIFVPQA